MGNTLAEGMHFNAKTAKQKREARKVEGKQVIKNASQKVA